MLRHFFVDNPLCAGGTVALHPDLSHRLTKVLRLSVGDVVGLWNGVDGLWEATLQDAKGREARVGANVRPQPNCLPLRLALCVPKRDAWESALRQATELGVMEIFPLESDHGVVSKVNESRARDMLVEAAEQCERLSLPRLHPLQPLTAWLKTQTEPVAWAWERGPVCVGMMTECLTLLVGPEGGFSPREVALLAQHPAVRSLSLGETILRVDTAVVAGLARLQT